MALQDPLIPAPQKGPALTPRPPQTASPALTWPGCAAHWTSSVSDNTRAMYNSAWRSFETWAHARGALALPASPSIVAAYSAHLAEERRVSVATVRLHKAAPSRDPQGQWPRRPHLLQSRQRQNRPGIPGPVLHNISDDPSPLQGPWQHVLQWSLPDSQLLTNREIPTAAPPHRREDSAIST